jgi:hypothetical protein
LHTDPVSSCTLTPFPPNQGILSALKCNNWAGIIDCVWSLVSEALAGSVVEDLG